MMPDHPSDKTPLPTEIDALLAEHGQSVAMASRKSHLKQMVSEDILRLFDPNSEQALLQQAVQSLLQGYQQGVLTLQDIVELREFVVEYQRHLETAEQGDQVLYEAVQQLLTAAHWGQSVSSAAQVLAKSGQVAEHTLSAYYQL